MEEADVEAKMKKLLRLDLFHEGFVGVLCAPQDIGAGKGKYYAVNFPLRDGIDDESYEQIFKPVRCIQTGHEEEAVVGGLIPAWAYR